MSYITSYCHISSGSCSVNGVPVSIPENEKPFTRNMYDRLMLEYPKYHKMDTLSKVGVAGTEFLLQQVPHITRYGDDQVALVFSNPNASADTDTKFRESYVEGAPGPALFVYTLPNIVQGEIAILRKWYGEQLFFVSQWFNADLFFRHISLLMVQKAEACIGGWIHTEGDEIDALLFIVEKNDTTGLNLEFTPNNLANLH